MRERKRRVGIREGREKEREDIERGYRDRGGEREERERERER